MVYQFPVNGGRLNASIGGNSTSAGAGYAMLSTGTMVLAGGNNITLSQNGSNITISGANAPSGSINFSASNTSANLASVTFSNSNGVSFGLNAGVITASHNALTSQSNQTVGIYATGANTTGQSSSNTMDARSFVVSGQGMYAGMSGSTLQLSVATTYAASNHSHGNPTLALTNLSGTTASASNGLTLSLSAAAPPTAGSNTFGMSNAGNTSGTTGVISGSAAQLILAGGNNVTLSQSINGSSATITISAPNQSVQTQNLVSISGSTGNISFSNSNNVTFGGNASVITASASFNQSNQTQGFSAGGNTSLTSTGTFDARSVYLNGLGAVSAGFSASSLFVSAPVQTVQTQNLYNLTIGGNTAGAGAAVSSGTLTLAGGNNITLSQAGNAITISGGAGGAAGSNTFGMSNLGNTSGTTGVISGSAALLAFAGGNNVTLSQSINGSSATISVSAANQTVQTQNIVSVNGSSGNISFSNSNNVTFGFNASTVTASASFSQTNQTQGFSAGGNTSLTSTGTFDARSMYMNGLGAASVGFSSSSMFISAPVQTVQTQNLMTVNGTQGAVSISGGANVTVGNNASTITISAAAQTNQTLGINVTGNTIQTNTGTVDARSLTFNGLGNVSVGYSNGSVQISGSAAAGGVALAGGLAGSSTTITSGTANLSVTGGAMTISGTGSTINFSVPQISSLSGTGAISISTNGNTISIGAPAMFDAGLSTLGNTLGNTGLNSNGLVLVGGNNITLSQATNTAGATITVSAPNNVQGSDAFGMSNLGNTSGTTGMVSGSQFQFALAGGNNIILSQSLNGSSGTITISASNLAQSNQTVGLYGLGNTTQNSSTTLDARSLSFNGIGDVTVGFSNGSVQISAPPAPVTLSRWEYPLNNYSQVSTPINGSLSLQHVYVPFNVSGASAKIVGSISANSSTAASTASASFTLWMGIYTLNGSTLSLITQSTGSANNSFTWQASSTNTSQLTGVNGMREMTVPMTVNMTPGQYWVAAALSSSSSVLSAGFSIQGGILVNNGANAAQAAAFGVNSTAGRDIYLFQGLYSGNVSSGPASIGSVSINNSSASAVARAMFYHAFYNATY